VPGLLSRSTVSICTADGLAPTDFYEVTEPIGPETWQTLSECIGSVSGEVTVISGSLPPDIDAQALATLAACAAYSPLIVDLAGPHVRDWLHTRPQPAVIKVNLAEARELCGRSREFCDRSAEGLVAETARETAREIAELSGAGLVIITCGPAGSVAVDASGAGVLVRPTEPGPYPVGSGDAFLGGFLVELPGDVWSLNDERVRSALRKGAAAAGVNAHRLGAGVVDAESVVALTDHVELFDL